MSEKVALIVGAGDSLGGAVARRFAGAGFTVCASRRNGDKLTPLVDRIRAEGGTAHGFGSDARRAEQMEELVEGIERDIGSIAVAVHNIGANVQFGILETTERVFFKVWELASLSAFHMAQAVARRMVPRGHGTMIFTGATASVRGAAGYSAFAAGMHGKRALAQSLARELQPKGIHVAHIIIDGPIDAPFTRERSPEMVAERTADGSLAPDDIAGNYLMLHNQPRSAWTHELDLRPWVEPW